MPNRDIPPNIAHSLLPDASNIFTWLNHPLPLLLNAVKPSDPQDFFSTDEPTTVDIPALRSIPCPPKRIVDALCSSIKQSPTTKSICCPHASINQQNERLPLFMLTCWAKLTLLYPAKKQVSTALRILEHHRSPLQDSESRSLSNDVYTMLTLLPWQDSIRGFPVEVPIHHLTAFFRTEWLGSEHIFLMTDLLEDDARANGVIRTEFIKETAAFTTKMAQAYNNPEGYATSQGFRWLSTIGQRLANREQDHLALVANINANHWVAIIIDINGHTIQYGNSLRGYETGSRELLDQLKWWLHFHFGEMFSVKHLPITQQCDGHNCGIFAWQALEAEVLGKELMSEKDAYKKRLELFKRVIQRHQDMVRFSPAWYSG